MTALIVWIHIVEMSLHVGQSDARFTDGDETYTAINIDSSYEHGYPHNDNLAKHIRHGDSQTVMIRPQIA